MLYDTARIQNVFSASYEIRGISNNEHLLDDLSGFALGSSDNALNLLTLQHHLCLAIDNEFLELLFWFPSVLQAVGQAVHKVPA